MNKNLNYDQKCAIILFKVLHNSEEKLHDSHYTKCVNHVTLPKSYVTPECIYEPIFTSIKMNFCEPFM